MEQYWKAYGFEHIFYVLYTIQSRLQVRKFPAYILCLFQGEGETGRNVEMSECLTENEGDKKE